ncbi:hypothetical protein LCGC14_0628390 [marine sediment metagenome]|uniref:VTT domain-containing protein n=1 Tax=marine sediment metagenome TaxID=412755 RepID=A0A0F9R2R3_9ZZZZ
MQDNETNRDKQKEEKQVFSTKLKNYFKNLLDFSQYNTKTILYIILFIVLIILSLFLLFYINFIDRTILFKFVVDWFVNPVNSLGFFGILLFIAIMGLQGLIVPIPSEIVLLATGMIWGFFLGGIMGIIGSMAAGTLCFYVSKKGGRPLAEKFVGAKTIDIADEFIKKHGITAIIITRFIPFIPFDVISYTSGLVDIKTKKYLLGTLIGSIFRAFFWSWLGASLGIKPPIDFSDLKLSEINAMSEFFNAIVLIILAVVALMFLVSYLTIKHYEKKKLIK